MDSDEVLRVQNAVFILSSCINDLRGVILPLVLDHTTEGIFNGWIIAFDEMSIDELHRERRFADGSTAHNGDLSLLRRGWHLGKTSSVRWGSDSARRNLERGAKGIPSKTQLMG